MEVRSLNPWAAREVLSIFFFCVCVLFIYFARAGSLLLCVLFSTCGERVLLSSRRARASLVVEHGLWGAQASVVAARGSAAQTQQLWYMA